MANRGARRGIIVASGVVVALVVALLAWPDAPSGSGKAATGLQPLRNPPVVAFYYPWYGTPQVSGAWRHWNNDGHDPTHVDPSTGYPDIAGTFHPSPGLYDSTDTTVLRRQLRQAQDAGIDALAVSWWGKGSFEDKALAHLMDVAQAGHYNIRFTIYYEQVPNDDPTKAIDDLDYILSTYGSKASWLRMGGRPVLLVYSRAIFPGEYCLFGPCPAGSPPVIDWKPILSAVHAHYNALAYGDRGTTLLDLTSMLATMGFDGVHLYNPQLDTKSESPSTIYTKLASQARQNHVLVADTIIPGYDDTHLGRKSPSVVDRQAGQLYTSLWNAARASRPDMYLITTFNEWHEGTEIEPALEYGNLYLDLTKKYSHPGTAG